MEYKKIDMGSYYLHLIKTKRFKTINFEVIFRSNIKKEEISYRNILGDILVYSSKKYPTARELSLKKQQLYGISLSTTTSRLGNFYNTDFNLTVLNEKYTEEGILEESLEFLSEIIFNPNVSNNMFDENSFNVKKKDNIIQLDRLKEDGRKNSIIKMLTAMDEELPYSYNSFGYLEDYEKIDRTNLYKYYKEFINNSIVDIYVVGDFEQRRIEKILRDKFKFKTFRNDNESPIIENNSCRKKELIVIEEESTSQAKLSIGCKVNDLSDYERNYVLTLYNIILGGSADSKMFRNIREKNSLCYYISSVTNKLDNILIISSGINKDNFDKTLSLVKKEMDNMRKGNIADSEIEKAKKYYISMLDEIDDYPNQIISSYYAMDILDLDYIEIRKEKIMKVNLEDIKKVSKKINMDTVYLLGGDI